VGGRQLVKGPIKPVVAPLKLEVVLFREVVDDTRAVFDGSHQHVAEKTLGREQRRTGSAKCGFASLQAGPRVVTRSDHVHRGL